MKGEGRQEEPPAPLPAPYEAPWRRLAADLQAVAAGAGLKLREWIRLNGEGRLRRPAFWPAELAPLFWPLALALGAALLVALLLAGQAALARRTAEPSPALQPEERPVDRLPAGEGVSAGEPAGGDSTEAKGASGPGADRSRSPLAPPGPDAPPPAPSPVAQSPAASPATPPTPSPAEQLAELRRRLLGPDPPAWVLDLQEQPAAALLQLQLGPGFMALPESRRRALAESWLERARQLGYERLELRDPAGALLARPARVGSGMILLEPLPPSP